MNPEAAVKTHATLLTAVTTLLLSLSLWCGPAHAQTPQLLADANQLPVDAYIIDVAAVGNTVFFLRASAQARLAASGEADLWVSRNGGNLTRIANIPGIESVSNPLGGDEADYLTVAGELLYIAHLDEDEKTVITVSDGTVAGTRLLTSGQVLGPLSDRLLFVHEQGLWSTYGGADSMTRLGDFMPDSLTFNPGDTVHLDEQILYYQDYLAGECNFVATEGTTEGTRQISVPAGFCFLFPGPGETAIIVANSPDRRAMHERC